VSIAAARSPEQGDDLADLMVRIDALQHRKGLPEGG